MLLAVLMPLSSHLYLFSTHITRNKIIAGVVVLVVVVVGLVGWFVMRRRRTPRQV